jgi:hypothetical protein
MQGVSKWQPGDEDEGERNKKKKKRQWGYLSQDVVNGHKRGGTKWMMIGLLCVSAFA